MNKLTYEQLYQKYEDAMDTIASQEMEIRELKQDLDDYSQAYEELLDHLADATIL